MFIVGAFVMGFSPTIPALMGGRLIAGFAIGVASQISNIYLAEISPKSIRGAFTSVYGLGIDIGNISAIGVSISLDRDWRLMLGLACVPSFI
jgi:MFS transporter, SP family, galactose:H+ symporter